MLKEDHDNYVDRNDDDKDDKDDDNGDDGEQDDGDDKVMPTWPSRPSPPCSSSSTASRPRSFWITRPLEIGSSGKKADLLFLVLGSLLALCWLDQKLGAQGGEVVCWAASLLSEW